MNMGTAVYALAAMWCNEMYASNGEEIASMSQLQWHFLYCLLLIIYKSLFECHTSLKFSHCSLLIVDTLFGTLLSRCQEEFEHDMTLQLTEEGVAGA